LMVPFKKL